MFTLNIQYARGWTLLYCGTTITRAYDHSSCGVTLFSEEEPKALFLKKTTTLKSCFICLVAGHGALEPNTEDLEEEIKEVKVYLTLLLVHKCSLEAKRN